MTFFFKYGTWFSHSHCHLSCFLFKWKTNSNESVVPLEAPKEIGPKVNLFCGLIMEQVGGRHLSPLRQRSGCITAVVGEMSQWIATQMCMWGSLPPHALEKDTEGTWGSHDLVRGATDHVIQLYCQTGVTWRTVLHKHYISDRKLYLFHPHILHSSSQKFAIILKRCFQTRLTQLWFSVEWDCFVFFIALILADHCPFTLDWDGKSSHKPQPVSILLTCLLFSSGPWIQIPIY